MMPGVPVFGVGLRRENSIHGRSDMNRPRISLRHTVFGALFTGSLLFGATQAFARPPGYVPIDVPCNTEDPNAAQMCREACLAADEVHVDGVCYGALDTCICQVW
jgi:hypothetical protein